MKQIEAAILRTVLYANIFSFPLTVEEIHHFLIDEQPASLETVRDTLQESTALQRWLRYERGYVLYGAQHR